MSKLMHTQQMNETLRRLAKEVTAAAPTDADIAVIGIRRRGEVLGRTLCELLKEVGRPPKHYGVLDITLYRDDLSTIGPQAQLRGTEIDFDLTDKWVVLVDDVLYTGRSVRAALDALIDLGRPRAIKLAVLVDRGWRELPIQPDFVGLVTKTSAQNIVKVKVAEIDGTDEVELA